uniref:DUF4780 domain-containing protein n=1 Tax=Clastoptera arizonana TaxID=38151 RepID=A0A1B6CEK4_9HEMI
MAHEIYKSEMMNSEREAYKPQQSYHLAKDERSDVWRDVCGSTCTETEAIKRIKSQTKRTRDSKLHNSNMKKNPPPSNAETTELFIVEILPENYPQATFKKEDLTALEEAIVAEMLLNPDCELKFRRIFYSMGIIIVNCHNSETASWLMEKSPKLTTWKGTKLMACNKGNPWQLKITMFIPNCESLEINKFLCLLQEENDGLNTSLWRVIKYRNRKGNMFVRIAVDNESANYIKEASRYLLFKCERIHVGGLKIKKQRKSVLKVQPSSSSYNLMDGPEQLKMPEPDSTMGNFLQDLVL